MVDLNGIYEGFVYEPFPKKITKKKISAILIFKDGEPRLTLNETDVKKLCRYGFGGAELFGVFRNNSASYSNQLFYFTFINSSTTGGEKTDINFEKFYLKEVYHHPKIDSVLANIEDDSEKKILAKIYKKPKKDKFLKKDDKIKSLDVYIDNLDKFLWLGKYFRLEYLNSESNKTSSDNAEFLKINIPREVNKFDIIIDNAKCFITIFSKSGISYENILESRFYNDTYIRVETEEEQSLDFYKQTIFKINAFFSLLCNQNLEIKKYCNGYDYYFINPNIKNEKDYVYLDLDIPYDDIKNALKAVMQKWFDNFNKLRFLIVTILSKENNFLDTYLISQIQALEVIGNIEHKKNKSGVDVKNGLELINNDNFETIFIYGGLCGDWHKSMIKRTLYPEEFPEYGYKEYIKKQVSLIRNLITHPYKNGRPRKLSSSEISTTFYFKNETLNWEALSMLSNRLDLVLKTIIYQTLGIDKHFPKIQRAKDNDQ
ncbi:MAG: hypothetical protein AB7U85_06645 [Alphaproteobacteria bacterium]